MYKYICGGPTAIYGAVLPPDLFVTDAVDELTLSPERFGITVTDTVFGPANYWWPITKDVFVRYKDEVRDFLQYLGDRRHRSAPAVMLMKIDDATVSQNIVYCRGADGQRILYESFRWCERESAAAARIVVPDTVTGDDLSASDCHTVYFGTAGYFNYGHWLVDDLPKVKGVLTLLERRDKPVRLLLPDFQPRMNAIREESLRLLLGDEIRIEFISPTAAHQIRDLFYVSPVTHHPLTKSPIALDFLVNHTLACANHGTAIAAHGRTERIFVSRGPSWGRTLLNEATVRDHLAGKDFQIIEPMGMSFVDQVRVFSRASVVVGSMGAAMTNTLFCRPTTAIIHLAPPVWREPFYIDLAMARGHRSRTLFGESNDHGREPHERDFVIDLAALDKAIASL